MIGVDQVDRCPGCGGHVHDVVDGMDRWQECTHGCGWTSHLELEEPPACVCGSTRHASVGGSCPTWGKPPSIDVTDWDHPKPCNECPGHMGAHWSRCEWMLEP